MTARTLPAARPWYVSALLAVLAVALLLGGVWLYARLQSPYPYYGTVYTPPQPAARFQGTDGQGRAYAFTPTGHTTALFFGFTHCPDVCPLTLGYLEKAREQLTPEQQRQFQVVFVSLDPARDTPDKIGPYVRYFGTATGVRVPEPALAQLARSYGVSYVKAPLPGQPGEYQINHTSATYLIDAQGQRRLIWDYTQLSDINRVVQDIQQVMQ
ncbi:SCO family protein [Deinococcus sonorensis]|uniref:SCO family protein n=2 Tax=Deinococcus sonorensis TaxID=309891 RepID=A0AAU7U8N3_9DEIO